MKQLNPTCILFSKDVNTADNFKKHYFKAKKFSKQKRKTLRFLYAALFVITGICFIPRYARAETSWEDNNKYWHVDSFNAQKGTIGISLRVYDHNYFPFGNPTDAWVQQGTLGYNINGGGDYETFFRFGWDTASNKDTSSILNGETISIDSVYKQSIIGSSSDTATWIHITLYVTNSNKHITYLEVNGFWHEASTIPLNGVIAGTRYPAIQQMSSFDIAPVDFVTMLNSQTNMYEAKGKVGYKKTLNGIDSVSKIQLFNRDNFINESPLYDHIAADYAYDYVNTGNDSSYYYLQQAYFDHASSFYGRVDTTSPYINVPAFPQPKTAIVTYDTINHTAIFTWQIDPVNTTNLIKSNFKIQVSGDPSFKNFTLDSVVYNNTDNSFSYTTQNLLPKMYFRVSRDYNSPDWHLWDVAKEDSITIPFLSIDANKTKATLQDDNSVLITWNPDPAAWLPGSSFIITKYNNTIGTQSQFTLTEKDFDLGYYADKQIATCTEYVYTLQVVPPTGSQFNAYSPISVDGSIIRADIGKLLTMNASKGYFPDRTELNWKVSGAFDNFIIKRAVYGDTNYVQILTVPAAFGSTFQTNDEKGIPGTYYSYMMIGYLNCNKTPVYAKDTLYAIGFRSPTGNIHGRITYVSGQAVQNASVRVQSKDAIQAGQSIYLNGDDSSYMMLDSLNKPFTDTAATIETWIKPSDASPTNQVIFSHGEQYELGFNKDGQLYFTYNGKTVTGKYQNINGSFIHVAGVHSKDSLSLMLNDLLIGQVANNYQQTTDVDAAVYIGRNKTGNNYKGFIDEMRVWNIALPDSIIARDYTRILTGGENGLAAYWRFDETIPNEFYDLSYKSTVYNMNDGNIHGNAIHSSTIPTPDQLSFKSYTDSTGNYLIAGIPYTGNGTTYSIVPLLGTHVFDPVSDSRFISASSTDFTVNFTDKSSFPVSGTIYYSNTTVPVSGVQFKIDGQYAQTSDGTLIQTDNAGNFNITVPVGIHKVQAVKANHVFEENGEILNGNKEIDYQTSYAGIHLYDSTTIRFIGRVCGGTIQAAYPLGYSLSKNNLGDSMFVVMKLAGGSTALLNINSTVRQDTIKHLQLSDPNDSDKIHKTVTDYYSDRIVIHPDSLTGEFAADIIPEKFIADTAFINGWNNIIPGQSQPSFDFTNDFYTYKSSYNYVDSTLKDSNWVSNNYSDSVAYNDSALFIERVTPSITIVQTSDSLDVLPYFGDYFYGTPLISEKIDKSTTFALADTTKTGTAEYVVGHPAFTKNVPYLFKINAFESYPFHLKNGAIETTKDGKQRIDNVPTQDGHVTINNEMKAGTTSEDDVSLNSDGTGYYSFAIGDPDIGSDGLESFDATLKFGTSGTVAWQSYDNTNKMQCYVLGGKSTGTDFVTEGPNEISMVLRDPPGSRSFSYAQQGFTTSSSSTYSGSFNEALNSDLTIKLGEKVTTWEGVGAGLIEEEETTDNTKLGVEYKEEWTNSNTKEETNTITNNFQTSDDPHFVGELGDVFIGHSTNITYGTSNNIIVLDKTKNGILPDDIPLTDSNNRYVVVQRIGFIKGITFNTLFAYTQQVIEFQMIPHLDSLITGLLNVYPVNTSATQAQQYATETMQPVYISHLAKGDENFGRANQDSIAFGADAANSKYNDGKSYTVYYPAGAQDFPDSVFQLNQYIDNWKQVLADNEKAKLQSKLEQNYSFHAGSPITHSEQTEITKTSSSTYSWILSGNVSQTLGGEVLGIGLEFTMGLTVDSSKENTHDNSTTTSNDLGFTLASDGTDDYISVDENKAPDGSFAFITKGGESACPYEGATYTKYYKPGTLLNQATAQIEVPKFDVDTHEVDNVPSSRPAVFNLTLRNESEAGLPATFILGYVDNNSIKGATIAVDGVSIAGTGRAIVVQYGQTVNKVLTITKGPNALNYDSIMIIWHSACQYDLTSYQATIADTQIVAAHFIPSCSDISLSAPAANWILNTKSPVDSNGIRYLPVTIDKFDTTNILFDHIALQYKSSSSSEWLPAATFYADSTKLKAATGSNKYLITDPAVINYDLEMNNTLFPDQNYDIRAVSSCSTGQGNPPIVTLSDIVSGIKDTITPRPFGLPQPANGVLGASDEIKLTFNEPINGGLLTNNNFQVTGIKNGSQGDHSVSVYLDGKNDYLATEFAKNFTGKSITAEMWVKQNTPADGTLFSQGSNGNSMELALTSDKHLQVIIGNKTITSDEPVIYTQDWAHVALVYNDVAKTVSAFYNFKEVISAVTVNSYTGTGHLEFGRSISSNSNYFNGNIDEARIWTKTMTSVDLQTNSLTNLSGGESGFLAYYPMSEGKGTIAYDKANGSNATITGNWSTPAGKAITFNKNGYLQLKTDAAPIDSAMDYTIELWFKGAPGQTDATLASNGKGDGTDGGGSKDLFFLGFENGLLTYTNNSFKIQADGNYLDNNWHHVAVAVNHVSGTAQIFVDGVLNKYFDASNAGGIAAPYIYLGVRAWHDEDSITITNFDRYFSGSIDEFRIWNAYLNQTLINKNNNVHLNGDEFGLKIYYPFETYTTTSSNITTLDSSLQDMAINGSRSYAVGKNATSTNDAAPIESRGPVSNLAFDYVVNNDAVIINLMEQKSYIDKTIVTLNVKGARDKNGNTMASPVVWTAYINQNPLKWSDDVLNLSKDVNAPMQFESYVINSGGNVENFTIDNLPRWLTADITSGSLNPQGQQKITFTVNERTNIGAYNEIINLHNDENETDGLSVNLTVKGKQPDWSVDPGSFKYNMGVYGKIRVNNIFSSDSSDLLAAFMNGKCVGVTHNIYNAGNDLWYAFLTVYSDSIKYNNLEFRIWDAATGTTYQAIPSQNISFSNDAIIGSASNPVIFDGKQMLYQNIDLNQGWNWISFNVTNPHFNNIDTSLSNGNWSSGDIVKNNDVGFDQYSSTSGWLGYLPTFNNTSMYMLSTANAQTLSMLGTAVAVDKTAIPLKGGRWNYISYLPGINLTLKQALAGYNASDEDVIKSQTGFAMYDSQNGWVGSLTYLEPGEGYMFYRKQKTDTSFYYPVNVDPLDGLKSTKTNTADSIMVNNLETPSASNFNYANNMTVTAVIASDYTLQSGDIILANVGSEIRGKAKLIHNAATNNGALFFNISGEEEQPVSFAVQRNDKIVAESDPILSYHSDAEEGTLHNPLLIHMKKGNHKIVLISAYPNPFNQLININVDMPSNAVTSTHEIHISVYNSVGQLILTRGKEQVYGNHYQTTWNGRRADGSACTAGLYFIYVMIDDSLHVYKVIKN